MNKNEKIVETVALLKLLNETGIDLVRNAISACLTVQSLENIEKDTTWLEGTSMKLIKGNLK